MQKKTFTLILTLLVTFLNYTLGQELAIKSLVEEPNAIIKVEDEKKDLAGRPCGLVKVQLARMGAEFEGEIVETAYKTSEYWVYMEAGAHLLTVKHPDFVPLKVDFRDYGIERIEGKRTYTLTLNIPENSQNSYIETFTVKGVSFSMVRVEGGTFTMGATKEQGSGAAKDEQLTHQVTLSTYSIGETEVTQELWNVVMGSSPSHVKGSNLPVERVSWDDCQKFIKKLNKLTNRCFRLPTEAEWEYAARGGGKSRGYKYSGSDQADDVAWVVENSGDSLLNTKLDLLMESMHTLVSLPTQCSHNVKLKQANELGLYDMSGNVWEWCQDWYGTYSSDRQTNPTGPASGTFRVCRGGSFDDKAKYSRSSRRCYYIPSYISSSLGLRLAL